jgi:hypothetical protein
VPIIGFQDHPFQLRRVIDGAAKTFAESGDPVDDGARLFALARNLSGASEVKGGAK